jgi:hypothetical protein
MRTENHKTVFSHLKFLPFFQNQDPRQWTRLAGFILMRTLTVLCIGTLALCVLCRVVKLRPEQTIIQPSAGTTIENRK